MIAHTDKTSKNERRTFGVEKNQMLSFGWPAAEFSDKRPEARQRRQIQVAANRSPRMSQLREVQDAANASPQVRQLAQLQARANSFVAQESSPVRNRNHGMELPRGLKYGIEQLSGLTMDDVTVHYNSRRPAQMRAHAFAIGSEIHLAPGQEKQLPHEAWHLVQQKQGRVQASPRSEAGSSVNEDAGLELEAETMGAKALSLQKTGPATPVALNTTGTNSAVYQFVRTGQKRGPESSDKGEAKVPRSASHGKAPDPPRGKLRKSEHPPLTAKKAKKGAPDTVEVEDGDALPLYPLPPRLLLASKRKSHTQSRESVPRRIIHEGTPGFELIAHPSSTSGTTKEFWINAAKKLQSTHKALESIAPSKIAIMLLIYKKGVFNAFGEGANTRYFRSDSNVILQLLERKLSAADNKEGKVPDVFDGISPSEWVQIVAALTGRKSAPKLPANTGKEVSTHIRKQRSVSKALHDKCKRSIGIQGGAKMDLIFHDNYPALNIHFPQLHEMMESTKAGAAQFHGMSRFLMARLINLFNAKKHKTLPPLVEKSSFGFKTPTLGDLGDNMTIRLSPGTNREIVPAMVWALETLATELSQLLQDRHTHQLPQVDEESSLYKYWATGANAATLCTSFNTPKTILQHLLCTRVEKGDKKFAILGRVLERRKRNLIYLASLNRSLLAQGYAMLELHAPRKIEAGLKGTKSLAAPELLPMEHRKTLNSDDFPDRDAAERLRIFHIIADRFREQSELAEGSKEPVSGSDFEEDYLLGGKPSERPTIGATIRKKKVGVFGGKVVLGCGMEAYSVLLRKHETGDLRKRLFGHPYYEFYKHKKKALNVPGYRTADACIVDLNPCIPKPDDKYEKDQGRVAAILETLVKAQAKVWIVDITSSTAKDQKQLYAKWLKTSSSELLIKIGSGLKHQEEGLNMNPHGTLHWVCKNSKNKKEIQAHFAALREKFPRSVGSNAIRRYFKRRGANAWRNTRPSKVFSRTFTVRVRPHESRKISTLLSAQLSAQKGERIKTLPQFLIFKIDRSCRGKGPELPAHSTKKTNFPGILEVRKRKTHYEMDAFQVVVHRKVTIFEKTEKNWRVRGGKDVPAEEVLRAVEMASVLRYQRISSRDPR